MDDIIKAFAIEYLKEVIRNKYKMYHFSIDDITEEMLSESEELGYMIKEEVLRSFVKSVVQDEAESYIEKGFGINND